MAEDDDFEIIDVENYAGSKDQAFSHQVLVMKVMSECIKLGCKELHEGYSSVERDKEGKSKVIYKEDTRRAFIEAVKTAEMMMACDIDDDAEKEFIKIDKEMEKVLETLLIAQKTMLLNPLVKDRLQKQKIVVDESYLHEMFSYYKEYLWKEVDMYRKKFAELTRLTKRLNFYEQERFEG